MPKYSIRRVQYTREEIQVIDNKGNRLNYVDPERNNGEIMDRKVIGKEGIKILMGARLLTEDEAALMNLPFEGERIGSAD